MVLKGQEERTAVVRSITTQYLSFSLASSDASGAETKATLSGNPAELPLLHALRARGSCPPYAWGMLKNKHIPFRKWESKRFGIIDSVHKRCSSGWKGQVTMQFQYSGCFNCLFFLLFFALSISMQTFVYKSFGLKLLKFSHNGQENCPLEGSYMYQDLCMLFFSVTKAESPPLPCPIKMHECKEVCMVCLLQCTTLCAVSWEIELGFELELVSHPSMYLSLGPVFYFFIQMPVCIWCYSKWLPTSKPNIIICRR